MILVDAQIEEDGDDELAVLLAGAVDALGALLDRVKMVPPPKGWTYSQIGHVEGALNVLRHQGGV